MDLMTKAYNMSHEHDKSHADAPQQRPDLMCVDCRFMYNGLDPNRIIIGPRFASASSGSSPRLHTTTRCFSQHMELLKRMHYLHRLPHYTPS